MPNRNITFRQLVNILNMELRGIYNKPLILRSRNDAWYTRKPWTREGRYPAAMNTVRTVLREQIGCALHEFPLMAQSVNLLSYEKDTPILKATKIERLGLLELNCGFMSDAKTLVEVDVVNPKLLDVCVYDYLKSLRQNKKDIRNQQFEQEQLIKEQEDIAFKHALEQELKKYNMPLSVFMTMQQSVEKANYSKRKKLGVDR